MRMDFETNLLFTGSILVVGIHYKIQIKYKWMNAIIFILCEVFSWIFMIFIWLKRPNANKNDFTVEWLWFIPTLISVIVSSGCHSIHFFGRFFFQVIFNRETHSTCL